MSEVKDKLITAENLKNAYDDNKRAISELKGDLSNLKDDTDLKSFADIYDIEYRNLGDVVTISDPNKITHGYASSRYASSDLYRLPNTAYKLKFNTTKLYESSTAYCCTFYDDEKNFLIGVTNPNVIINIPSNAEYVRYTAYIVSGDTFNDIEVEITKNKIVNEMKDSVDRIDLLDVVPTNIDVDMTSGRYINTLGVEIPNGNTQLSVSPYIEISNIAIYKIKTNAVGIDNLCNSISFYDEKKVFISGHQNYGSVPSNAKYFRLCNFNSASVHNNIYYFLNSFKRIENIEEQNKSDLSNKKWCGIGDSITEENFRSSKHYWDYIIEETGITFVNKGIGGTGYKQYLPFKDRITEESFPTDCDVITIFGGINDIVGWGNSLSIGEPTDNTDSTICGCVNLAIDELENKYPIYCPLGIISPLPAKVDTTYEAFSDCNYPNQYPLLNDCRMEEFVDKLKTICEMRGYPFLDLFHTSGLRPWNDNVKRELFSPPSGYGYESGDGLHPNAEGHKKFYSKIENFIHSIILK